ncbi:MAG: Beta-hexosaminidase [Myxococcaceae bacterium]|nr:Beta-hexosaminidase [Myxococcaceae bacterium]
MVGSLSVLCGQMLVVGLGALELDAHERRLLASGERGGVVLFRRNVGTGAAGLAAVRALNAAVSAACPADLPPLVAVDQEGGRVMRLGPPAMQLPPMRRLGDADSSSDAELVRRVAEAQARELAALGFTMSFAPVADVHTRDENPIIGDRAFATTPEGVARLGGAWAEGLARGRVLSCAKHFPGHGDTTVDSHLALPRVDRPKADLERLEIASFRALAKNPAVDSMMTAHVVYPALDPEQPATLSRAICTDLLRGELGFSGVLFSDDLEMKALTMPTGEAAVRAVDAGCDVLLVCSRADLAMAAHEALVHEAEKSATFRARCEEAFARGIAMRRRVPPAPVAADADLARIYDATAPVSAELARRLEGASR